MSHSTSSLSRILLALALIVGCVVALAPVFDAHAAPSVVPRLVSYQGLLTDDLGTIVPDGTYTINFRLYTKQSGGTQLWSETQTVTTVSGVFDVQLGSVTPMTVWTFYNQMWLGMLIEGTLVSTPRTPILSTPFSFRAASLESGALTSSMISTGALVKSLNGVRDAVNLVPGANVSISQAGQDITISATGGGTGGDDGDWTISGANLYHDGSGTVALGTTTPGAMTSGQTMLQVQSSLWPGIALDRAAPSFQRWLIFQEGINNRLIFTHATTTGTMGSRVLSMDTDGDVGIGMDNPLASLDIYGGSGNLSTTSGDLQVGNPLHHFRVGVYTTGANAGEVNLWAVSPTGTPSLEFGIADHDVVTINDATMDFYGNAPGLLARLGGDAVESQGGTLTLYGHTGGVQPRISFDAQNANNSTMTLRTDDGQLGVHVISGSGTNGGSIDLYNGSGVRTIEIDATYAGGSGRIRTPTLEITGGSDLSEQFKINSSRPLEDIAANRSIVGSSPEAGMVVAIDPDNPGELMLCDVRYDRRVAGVISGAGGVRPGMLMGQQGSIANGDHPVALTGRVYVWVDASEHSVEPGDLLTTSSVAGHAMKVTDHGRAIGAILGKAMSRLESGRGLVLTLVSLQ